MNISLSYYYINYCKMSENIIYTGTIIDIVGCLFTKIHIITFELFEEKITKNKYMIVSKSQEDGTHLSYCIDYNNIPKNINLIYTYAKKYSKIIYDNNMDDICVIGTILNKPTEHNYIIARFNSLNFPLG